MIRIGHHSEELNRPFPCRVVNPDAHLRPILFDPHIDTIRVLQVISQLVIDISRDARRPTSEIGKLRGVIRGSANPDKVVVAVDTDTRRSQATCVDADNVLQDKIRAPALRNRWLDNI